MTLPDDLSQLLSASTISGWDVLFAALALVIGWFVSLLARKGALVLLRRLRGLTEELVLLVARLVKYAVLLLFIGIALGFLGAQIQPLLAAAIIVGVVLVLALRGIAGNFAAGVVIQTRRPIKVGDEVEVAGHTGTVAELNGRSVVLHSVDGLTVHVPNEQVLAEPLVNHSALGARRSEVELRARLGTDDAAALSALVLATAAEVEGVHKREPAHVFTTSLSPQRITLRLRYWHHPLHGPTITSAVVDALGAAVSGGPLRSGGIRDFTVQSQLPATPLTPPNEV